MTEQTPDIKLSKAQKAVYLAIIDYFAAYDESPTITDIVEYSGYSLTTVTYRIPELVEYGLITRMPNRPRGLALTDVRLPGCEPHMVDDVAEAEAEAEAPWKQYDDNPRIL